MMSDWAMLNGREVVPCTVEEWEQWWPRGERIVGRTPLENGYRVSTVFLGLDHSFGDGPPLWFETMVFPVDSYTEEDMERYSTWDEAEAGHIAMVRKWMDKAPYVEEEA
jgi:hypothetical protein